MWGTARHDLEPARAFADSAAGTGAALTLHVDLEARLDEREEAGTKTRLDRPAEDRFQNRVDNYLPRRERDPPVDDQRFVLEKRTLVTSVGRLVAIDPPRVNEAERRFMSTHVAHAGAGQMRSQAEPLSAALFRIAIDPVGVHALSGRVVRREVQPVEVKQLARYLGPVVDLEAERAEGVVEVIKGLGNGVEST